ncbi:MAG TPA: hypothetical protein DDY98_03385 [Ruminococcaceae bacterium]|nr:hypothetical protein [Oscillospiraceae bacterium]
MDIQLKCNPGGKFNIMCLGDLHEKADNVTPLGKAKAEDMELLVTTALDCLKPDLVVLMGDTCTDSDNDADVFRALVSRVVKPMIDRKIPFAFVMGNHEHDGHREKMIVDTYRNTPYCLVYNDDPSITGNLNYNLLVKSSDGERNAFNLWCIDSNNLCEDESVSVYDWVHKDQIEWYERKAEELKKQNGGTVIPAVLFQHIPVAEEYNAMRPMKPWELYQSVKGHAHWSKCRYVAKENMRGYLGEGPCAPCHNEGQFESWKKTGDILGAFFGHDHLNDFTCVVDGITMGQCKTAGFRCFTDGCHSCVRLVTLDENEPNKVETEVYHFKEEFGLKCKSLGPIKRTFNDKQSIALTVASRVAMGAAAIGVGAAAVRYIQKRMK